jgi:hypothetical protein
LVPGTNYTYQIYGQNIDGLSNTPGTSNSVLAWTYPYQVNNLELINTSATSLLAQWDISENITGLPDEDLLYELILTDASDTPVGPTVITSDLSYSFTGLISGDQYFLTVYAGVTFNAIDYFNPVAPASTSNYAHGFPLPVTNLSLSNVSATALNATWSLPSGLPIDGLTLNPLGAYTVYLDASFEVTTNNLSDELSGLTENQIYTVSVYANYVITGTTIVIVSDPESATGAPHGPPTPTVLTATATNTLGPDGEQQGQTVLLSWTLDSEYPDYTTSTEIWRQITDTSNGTVVTDPSFQLIATLGNYDTSFTDTGVGDASSVYFVNGNLMTYYALVTYTDNGFTPSSTYDVTSNQSSTIPYGQAPAPVGLTVNPGENELILSWTSVSDSYDLADLGLEFKHYIMYKNGSATGVTTTSTTYPFTGLDNNVEYSVGVSAYYEVGEGIYYTGTTATSAVSDASGVPYSTPDPQLSVTATNTLGASDSQLGKRVILNWHVESLLGYTNTTNIYRKISAPNGTVLTDPSFEFVQQVGNGVTTYTDDGSGNAANFLNGNTMTYYVDVNYSGAEPFTAQSLEASAVPYARPIPCDASGIEVDLSLCIVPVDLSSNGTFTTFKTTVSKNGAFITTFVAVGLTSNGNAPVIILEPLNNYPDPLYPITYSNTQLDGVCAADQVAQITLTFETSGVPVSASDVLDVISNLGGSLVAAYPSDGAFNLVG